MLLTTYIVDDESNARDRLVYLISQFLNGNPKVIGQAGEAETALLQVPKLAPDVLFLDVEMPGMSGLELASRLQASGYKGRIIFITAYEQYAIKAIRANAFDYLLKPIDVDELKLAISRVEAKSSGGFNQAVVAQFGLTDRELELIAHLAKGLSSDEIAAAMFLSRHTIDTHKRNIYLKTGTRNSIELLNLLRG